MTLITRQLSPVYFPGTLIARHTADLSPIRSGRYVVRLARDRDELESALRLRHQVFNVELAGRESANENELEFDTYDFKCLHLIVIDEASGSTVGTYRLNSMETALSTHGFYSANEFTIEDLPRDVLTDGIEIDRACIEREHRNTKVLFLLWKGLLAFLKHSGKRYYFGCCSIFTTDPATGRGAFRQLIAEGFLHADLSVKPCRNSLSLAEEDSEIDRSELPALFNMYLRIGARVCGPPMIDHDFGTTDFFVVFDSARMSPKYRKIFA